MQTSRKDHKTGKARFSIYPDLASANVFITGGSAGIGANLTEGFIAQGARVTFVSRNSDTAKKLCDAIAMEYGHSPNYIQCDISNVEALHGHMNSLQTDHGPIDILVNNAACDDRHMIEDLKEEEWDRLMAINLKPHFFTAQNVTNGMKVQKKGSIINIGSNCSRLGLAGYPAYVAAKGGIVALTRALARELGPHRIRVNSVSPGWVLTERQKRLWLTEAAFKECLAQQCIKDAVSELDVTQAVLFLASTVSAMITGQTLVVDGGRIYR